MPGFWESINARVSLEGKPFEAPWAFFIPRIELGKVARTVGIATRRAGREITGGPSLALVLLLNVHAAVGGGR